MCPREEPCFELRGRQVDALGEHRLEEMRVRHGVGSLRVVVVHDRTIEEEDSEQRADAIDGDVDGGTMCGIGKAFGEPGAESL